MPNRLHRVYLSLAILLSLSVPASARIGLVVGEPFGAFGTMMPVGHASIYIDHLCAASPTELRPCNPGELGVVIARYHDLTAMHLDWMAVPAAVFFYGVEDPANAPQTMTASLEAELRERYREDHLLAIAPGRLDKHGVQHRPPYGDWQEAIGAAFDRRLFLYTFDTTPTQDAQLLAAINALPNRRRYTLGRANCADFAADILALVLPAHPARNVFADFDMASPKNLARQIDALQTDHPELHLRVYELPQLPGSLRRSRPLRGAAETFVKTKRYLFTLIVLQPELVVADWLIYEARGRWSPGQDAQLLTPTEFANLNAPPGNLTADVYEAPSSSASTASSTASDAIGFRAK